MAEETTRLEADRPMTLPAPTFTSQDFQQLANLLDQASAVIACVDCFNGNHDPTAIVLRHDIDHDLDTAVRLAEWEADHGIRATYFILHDSPYWNGGLTDQSLDSICQIEGYGHEIGIHNNAIAVALQHGDDPVQILAEALNDLGPVNGHVAHGDPICYTAKPPFVNDEIFTDCARPDYGAPDRTITWNGNTVTLDPVPLNSLGLAYDANRLPRGEYFSDSGGRWNIPPADWPPLGQNGQRHLLVHPIWHSPFR